MELHRSDSETVTAAAEGQMQFPRTYTEEQGDGDNIIAYRFGDGRTLLVFHDYSTNTQTPYMVSDHDAKVLQARWRFIQMDGLAGEEYAYDYMKRLFEEITVLGITADPIEWWPGEQEYRDQRAIDAAKYDIEWKAEQEASLAKWRTENPAQCEEIKQRDLKNAADHLEWIATHPEEVAAEERENQEREARWQACSRVADEVAV